MINTLITLFILASLLSITLACFGPTLPTLLMLTFVGLMLVTPSGLIPSVLLLVLWLFFIVFVIIRVFPNVRKRFISKPIYNRIGSVLPTIDEIDIKEANNLGWEADMLSGKPDWAELFDNKRDLSSAYEDAISKEANLACQKASLTTGAYAKIRKAIYNGKLAGITEPLAHIAMNTYTVDAACQIVKSGQPQALSSTILKYLTTNSTRETISYAREVHADNINPSYLAQTYTQLPEWIAGTDGDVNHIIRPMIFVQGVTRCHPYVQLEVASCANPDKEEGLAEFDALFVEHLGHTLRNWARAFIFGITGGRLAPKTGANLPDTLEQKAQKAHQISATLALIADVSIFHLGDKLARKDIMTGNLSDAWMSVIALSANIKKWIDEGENDADLLLVNAACDELLSKADHALDKALINYPSPILGAILRWTTRPWGTRCHGARDKDMTSLATLLMNENDALSRLTKDVDIAENEKEPMNVLLDTQRQIGDFNMLQKKLRKAGHVTITQPIENMLEDVVKKAILTETEADRYLLTYEKIQQVMGR